MRIWTIHPLYLDTKGLVAVWREGLLAQKVLRGETRGYRHHPQLIRFQAQNKPLSAIAAYLKAIHEEAVVRGYHFDAGKIGQGYDDQSIEETEGQLLYEWAHLLSKLERRSPERYRRLLPVEIPQAHPLFVIMPGEIRTWERV